MINVGILTNSEDQLLPFLIEKIHSIKNIRFYIFVVKNNMIEKSLKIFKDRTGNYFISKKKNLYNLNVDIPIYFVPSHNSKKFYKILIDRNIKFLYNSGTPNKINSLTLKKVKGIINIHPGILPKYRGCTCPEWSLFNNDALGITAHMMDEIYDNGQILKTHYLKFNQKEIKDYKDLRIKIYLSTINLAKKILANFGDKKIPKFKRQNIKNSSYFKVISDNKLAKIKNKIKNGKYKFHLKNLTN